MPDRRTVMAALTLAGRAPSRCNAQPWRWRITDGAVHLSLDPRYSPFSTDPESRDALLGCGMVLHHLNVALAASGWATVIHRLPNAAQPSLLASLRFVPHRAIMLETALHRAITARHSDHRAYQKRPIPPGYLSLFSERAAALGGTVRLVSERDRACLTVPAGAAPVEAVFQDRAEYAVQAASHGDGPIGTAARVSPSEIGSGDSADGHVVDHAELLVVGTAADDPLSRVRAGEAISAVLLTATNIGLATCLLTQPLESRRAFFRTETLGGTAFPQALVRVGWAPDIGVAPAMTPRRPVEELLLPESL
ncbi:Acg family FMN-binding oxidoreductase [Nocardia fluminea]|uniref:Acg family FMN-binding oxidoreductase n=1 Tax=Nocardia fluminea TaxID=134984 RepID=UPI00381B49DF